MKPQLPEGLVDEATRVFTARLKPQPTPPLNILNLSSELNTSKQGALEIRLKPGLNRQADTRPSDPP